VAELPLTVGTAGHIDHGKTALVRALTGKDTDRLPEEHRRGISIELGYAQLELPSGRRLSVVDVPGHERFVRTMVAGASGVDLFLMCIAADDGVMPQTREHMAVLRQLGVERGVVAITKADAADPSLAADEAREFVPGVEVVAVSALKRSGLDELLGALDRVASEQPSRASDGPPRLHVDRAFTLKGIGTVVTGTLWSGSIAVGDQIDILPAGDSARVRSVQVHDRDVDRAEAGQRVALNLVGIGWRDVRRGDVVTAGGGPQAAHILDIRIELEAGEPPLEPGRRVHVHHGTRESPARVYPLGDGFAQLRMQSPIVAERGDRLILRRVAPPDTIGGGQVIDPAARRHSGSPELVERLHAMEEGRDVPQPEGCHPSLAGTPVDAAPPELDADALRLAELLRADGEQPRTDTELAAAAGLEAGAARRALSALERDGRVVRVGPNLHFDAEALAGLTARVVAICERDGAATIAGIRDELGTSRKYAQALLEHLDATRVTVRRDDEHVLRRRG
jgi:selenocysteine-specific elongation factor